MRCSSFEHDGKSSLGCLVDTLYYTVFMLAFVTKLFCSFLIVDRLLYPAAMPFHPPSADFWDRSRSVATDPTPRTTTTTTASPVPSNSSDTAYNGTLYCSIAAEKCVSFSSIMLDFI